MDNIEADTKPDFLPDKGESISLMEPMILGSECAARSQLSDLCMELAAKSASLRTSIPHGILMSLAELVRAMNCYYSNLIEGHDTHPIEIEKALRGDYSSDKTKRNLQLEAKAHIALQEWIDNGAVVGRALQAETILEIHKRFCEQLPEELLWVEGFNDREKVVPGALRTRYVQVGKHLAISPGAIPRFLERFQAKYQSHGKLDGLLSVSAAHHRLLWIHPFLDGNGRVARLVSHAQLLELLDTGGIWSVSRGLARNVEKYKSHLMECDQQRRNDYDGRGNLSERALVEFTRFFLHTCLDQVSYMESLIQPDKLRTRILQWVEHESRSERILTNAGRILEALLYRGDLPRAEVPNLIGVGDRQARRVVNALTERGVLKSKTDRAPLQLCFPANLASQWLPGLFPESPSQ